MELPLMSTWIVLRVLPSIPMCIIYFAITCRLISSWRCLVLCWVTPWWKIVGPLGWRWSWKRLLWVVIPLVLVHSSWNILLVPKSQCDMMCCATMNNMPLTHIYPGSDILWHNIVGLSIFHTIAVMDSCEHCGENMKGGESSWCRKQVGEGVFLECDLLSKSWTKLVWIVWSCSLKLGVMNPIGPKRKEWAIQADSKL